jgi:hypothetical protein
VTRVTFHPRALVVAIPILLLLWWAVDVRSTIALVMAVLVYGVLSFAGALPIGRGQRP